jgi:hypothetical protein
MGMKGTVEQDHVGWIKRLAAVLQLAKMGAEDPAVLSATVLIENQMRTYW